MEIKEKFKEIRKNNGLSQIEFAQILGVSTGLVGSIETGSRSVSKAICMKIKELYDIDLLEKDSSCIQSENIIAIPFHQIGAAAGAGTWLSDEPINDVMYFDKRFLSNIIKCENYKHLHIIYASGDSMDSGWNQPDDIKDGDLLIVDTSQTTGNNQIFVIMVNNSELRVKKLFKRGEALYISSNNSKYKEEVYYPDNTDFEVKVIGKVIWNGSKENV